MNIQKTITINKSVNKQKNFIITITSSTYNFNPLGTNTTKSSNTLKQFAG